MLSSLPALRVRATVIGYGSNMASIFSPASVKDFRYNATLGRIESDLSLSMGYASAANTLVNAWRHGDINDGHLLPITYLYRHAIELALKDCIRLADACLELQDPKNHVRPSKGIDHWLSKVALHRLAAPADRLSKYLDVLGMDKLPKESRLVLDEVHLLDPNGDSFKYAADARGLPSNRPTEERIDVVQLGEHFKAAHGVIAGGICSVLGMWLDEMKHQMG